MRGKLLIMAGAITAAIMCVGCGEQEEDRRPPPPQAYAPAPAARVNLYPLTAPPPGTTQPVQGYAPTRITGGAQYADAGSYGNSGVVYGPNAGQPGAPFAGGGYPTQFSTPTGYCTVEEIMAGSNPLVPINDPPVVVTGPGGVQQTFGSRNRGYLSSGTNIPGERVGPGGTIYGTVEGTADIVRPIGPTPGYTTSSYTGPTGYNTTTATTTYGAASYLPPTNAVNYPPAPAAPASSYGTTATSAPPQYAPPPVTYAPPLSSTNPTPAPEPGSAATYPLSAAVPRATATGAGYQLVPAPDIPPGNRPQDAAPSQWFEIIRPDNGPIRIGRLTATCVCVGVRAPNRHIAAGERALIEARILTRPPVNNLTYGIYVSIVEPVTATVDADVTIRY